MKWKISDHVFAFVASLLLEANTTDGNERKSDSLSKLHEKLNDRFKIRMQIKSQARELF